ncbi:hypothetical protein M5K25_025030 [Dendrobium thyrsiflorum]|uniref:1-phosphatidylinositol 4-kinase n=1 Tax=Dendrobium thyrsiflorum TaxID=117978 RepID=A0ABD0U3A8_DENTH
MPEQSWFPQLLLSCLHKWPYQAKQGQTRAKPTCSKISVTLIEIKKMIYKNEGFEIVYQRRRVRSERVEEENHQEDIMAERIPERDEGQSSQPIRISEDPDNVAPVGGSVPSIDPTPVGMDDMNAMSGNMMQLQMMNMMMQMMEKMQTMVGSAAPGVPPVVTPVTPTTPGSSINVETGDPPMYQLNMVSEPFVITTRKKICSHNGGFGWLLRKDSNTKSSHKSEQQVSVFWTPGQQGNACWNLWTANLNALDSRTASYWVLELLTASGLCCNLWTATLIIQEFLVRSAHCSLEQILVYLAVPSSSMIPMPAFESDSISSVKLRIQRCKGFMFKKKKLVFDDRELSRNDCLIRDYDISDGNVLHLVIHLSDIGFVTVKTYIYKYNDVVIHWIVHKCAKVRTQPIDKDLNLSILAPTTTNKEECKKPLKREVWIEPFVVNPKIILSPVIKNLIQSASTGLDKGNPPVMSSDGTSCTYFMQDVSGQEFVVIFKPIDEEPMAENNPRGLPLSLDGIGLKKGMRVGEGALREIAAYLLGHPISGCRTSVCDKFGFSGVPPTIMVCSLSDCFNHSKKLDSATLDFKVGSMQMYVNNCGRCEDLGPRAFPMEEIYKITVLDIRLANANRHDGNIWSCKEGEEWRIVLVPIDHRHCLPKDVSLLF